MISTAHRILLGDKMKRMRWAGLGWSCSTYGGRRGEYRVLVGKPEGTRPLGRPRIRWGNNIKLKLQQGECGGMD